jgi:RimJ/RimL family protein N-acetyltransferase
VRCPELVGERVVLRSWRAEETAWYVSARDELIFRWTTEHRTLTADLTAAAFAHFAGVPGAYGFAIAHRSTDEPIGNLPVTVEGRVAEIAYWLAPQWRGRGYLGEALDIVLHWLASTDARRATLEVHPHNAASIRAAERAGFQHTGNRRSTSFEDTGTVLVYERSLVE